MAWQEGSSCLMKPDYGGAQGRIGAAHGLLGCPLDHGIPGVGSAGGTIAFGRRV